MGCLGAEGVPRKRLQPRKASWNEYKLSHTVIWWRIGTDANFYVSPKNSFLSFIGNPGYLLFAWENRIFRLDNQMVRVIPFGKVQKTWAVIWGDVSFCSADLDILCIGSAFLHLRFYSFMLMHKNFTLVAVAGARLQKIFFGPMGLSLV